jgi:hypothetical protein
MTARRLFVYDPANPRRDDVLAFFVETVRASTRRVHLMIADPVKSREQEEKYHAIIGEIANAKTLYGKCLPAESWKRLLIDAFKHETQHDAELAQEWAKFGNVELLPAMNHPGFVIVGEQSRKFTVKLAAAFISWLLAFQATEDAEVMA